MRSRLPRSPNSKADRSTLLRQWRILTLLGSRDQPVTTKDLAKELETKEWTVQRDLKLFEAVGFPIASRTGPHGRKFWYRNPGPIPGINLTLTEAAAIYLGRRLMEPLVGTDLWQGIQEAYQKLEANFDGQTLRFLKQFAQAFRPTRFGAGDYSNYGDILDCLMIGIEDQVRVTLSYHSQSDTEPATRDVDPYHLVYHKGTLYLVGWAVEKEDFRNFKVDRISSATIECKTSAGKTFRYPDRPFDLQKYLAGSFGIYQAKGPTKQVRILFQPQVVRYVEEKHWHESEQLIRQPDGTLLATFTLSSFQEVKSWVLGFGPQARILEPPELVQEICEDLKATVNAYRPKITKRRKGSIQV